MSDAECGIECLRIDGLHYNTAKAMTEKVATEPDFMAEYERCSLCEKAFRSSPVEKRHSRTRSAEPTRLSTFRSSEKFVEVLVGGTVGVRSI